MTTKNPYKQQGDVILRPINQLPHGEQIIVSQHRCVLAEGESTGHAHVVESSDAELIRIGERMILSLPQTATVRHEEHKPIDLEPGLWEIGRVREWDYLSQMARPVQD